MGELKRMAEDGESAAGKGGDRKSSSVVELDDLGIEKTESFRCQKLAVILTRR